MDGGVVVKVQASAVAWGLGGWGGGGGAHRYGLGRLVVWYGPGVWTNGVLVWCVWGWGWLFCFCPYLCIVAPRFDPVAVGKCIISFDCCPAQSARVALVFIMLLQVFVVEC